MVSKVAQEILETLQRSVVPGYNDAQTAMSAWGATAFKGSEDNDAQDSGFWIKFKITSGRHFNGTVTISLDPNKTFTVLFQNYSNRTGEYSTHRRLDNVTAENLGSTIDIEIEGPYEPPKKNP